MKIPYRYRRTPKVDETFVQLENSLDYIFKDKILLTTALTHCSVGHNNNERLEYLGDALLGFIIAETVYKQFPHAPEGELTRLRAYMVKGETLAEQAKNLDLGQYIKLGSGELKSGGWRRKSILANTFEAIIGAVYLDSEFNTCRDKVLAIYEPLLKNISPDKLNKDPKTRLQEYLQAHKHSLPNYKIVMEEGEAHAKKFFISCEISELGMDVQAEGRSKRAAEQAAAQEVLNILKI